MAAVRTAADSPLADIMRHELLLFINKLWLEDPELRVLDGLHSSEIVGVLQVQQKFEKHSLSKSYCGGEEMWSD